MMKVRTTLAVLMLSTMPVAALATSERQTEAISQCLEEAHKNYEAEPGDARFWQMNQVGRYIRVWLKVRTGDDENIKALCKVHKRGPGITEMRRLGS